MIIGTAGHIDHGKTALIRVLTGVDTDRLPEERRRGISIELGFAPLTLDDGTRVSVVDVPGHERFVRTMIAGASGIDAALVVIAIDEGVMPQTREHCAILRALDVPVLAVALTKVDRVHDDDLPRAVSELLPALESLGVAADVCVVGVSARTGQGIAALRSALTSAASRARRRDSDDLFRFVVDRAFTLRGTGTIVTGAVWSGCVTVGEHVRALPDGRAWRVRGVQSHGSEIARASAGGRFALALADAAPDDVIRGTTLVTDAAWQPTHRVAVRADTDHSTLPRRFDIQLGGTVASAGRSTSSRGQDVLRLSLSVPIVARCGDRVVLRTREGADGIVGATVIDPAPDRAPTHRAATSTDQFLLLASDASTRGVPISTLPVRLGVSPSALQVMLGHADVAVVAERVYHREAMAELVDRVVAAAERDAAEDPFAAGSTLPGLRDAVRRASRADESAVNAAISAAIAGGRLIRRGDRVAPLGASLDAASADLLSRVTVWIAGAALEAPSLPELIEVFGSEAEGAVLYAERSGNLIRLGGVRYCATVAVAGAVARLREAMRPGREYTPSELRGVLGVSRKYLVPLLEYCDAIRITVRHSGGRVLADVSSP